MRNRRIVHRKAQQIDYRLLVVRVWRSARQLIPGPRESGPLLELSAVSQSTFREMR